MTMCLNVFNVWPKTSVLPVWLRDAKRLDTPATLSSLREFFDGRVSVLLLSNLRDFPALLSP